MSHGDDPSDGFERVRRYIEYETPGMGMVQNDVSAVVCFNDVCTERVTVDPATLVIEGDGVDVVSRELDPETGATTGYERVEIYCSPACRNDHYRTEAPE